MYKIGLFSKIGKVTVKALRFYEEEGLLKPMRIDAATGYRYYDSGQIPIVHKIVALRQCGFSIPEIRQIVNGKNIACLFAERRGQLEREVREVSLQLSSIESYIESIRENGKMSYEIVVKDLPACIVFSRRMIVENYDSYFDVIPRIGEECAAANPGLRCIDDPPYCFIEYHDGEYKERDIDIELRAAYAAVYRWIDDNGYLCADNPRESYIDGIWNKADLADWLTEVQVPIKRLD